MGWKFRIDRVDYERCLRVVGWNRRDDGRTVAVKSLVMEVHDDDGFLLAEDEAFIRMPPEDVTPLLQALVDACWDFGIRPTGVEDFKRTNDARGNHLADMRAIVGKQLGVQLPE